METSLNKIDFNNLESTLPWDAWIVISQIVVLEKTILIIFPIYFYVKHWTPFETPELVQKSWLNNLESTLSKDASKVISHSVQVSKNCYHDVFVYSFLYPLVIALTKCYIPLAWTRHQNNGYQIKGNLCRIKWRM